VEQNLYHFSTFIKSGAKSLSLFHFYKKWSKIFITFIKSGAKSLSLLEKVEQNLYHF
jgi:hypothetical protein